MNEDGTAIPASGDGALDSFRFYLDPKQDDDFDGEGHILSDKTLMHTSYAPECDWQAAMGDIAPGSHSVRVTAVNSYGDESRVTNPVWFRVPEF